MAKKKKEEQIRVEIQEQYAPLLSMPKVRYKLYYGGRAGGKSYGFADALLVLARQGKLLIACVREVQNSIKDWREIPMRMFIYRRLIILIIFIVLPR